MIVFCAVLIFDNKKGLFFRCSLANNLTIWAEAHEMEISDSHSGEAHFINMGLFSDPSSSYLATDVKRLERLPGFKPED